MRPDISVPRALEGLVYPYPNLKDFTLDENELERTCPLDLGRHYLDPQHDLGVLDKMPLELLSDTLVQLDVRSLMDFRVVNQRAMQVIDSIPQFRTIINHSPFSLRGILSVEAGARITCRDLYQTISSSRCELCNDFAGYIYVLDCSRVCFLCFSENGKYLPMSPWEVSRSFGIDRKLCMQLPRIKSVPGCYSPNEKTCNTRLVLVDRESARRAGIALHESALAMEQHAAGSASKSQRSRERTSRRAARVPETSLRQISSSSGVGNPRLSFAKRFMAVVRAPSVSLPEGPAEWGFHCGGCRNQYRNRPLHWRRKYIVDTFNDHIIQCGSVLADVHYPSRSTHHLYAPPPPPACERMIGHDWLIHYCSVSQPA